MLELKATKGILITMNIEICMNAKIVGLPQKIALIAKKYNGKATILDMSQCSAIMFIKFNNSKQEKEFLKDSDIADLIKQTQITN